MLDDRILAYASVDEADDELVVLLVDDRGNQGRAVARNDAGLVSRLADRLTLQLGRPIVAESRRWAHRPVSGGLDWVAFSAVENGLAALTAAAAGISLSQWLGGSVRVTGQMIDPDTLSVDGRTVEDASFDEIAAWLQGAQVAWLRLDPRVWSVAALLRLDALCRVLQVGLAIEVPDGSRAEPVAAALRGALPMATLGRPSDAQFVSPDRQKPVFSVGRMPA